MRLKLSQFGVFLGTTGTINDKNLNYEIETQRMAWIAFEETLTINDKNLNYEIETLRHAFFQCVTPALSMIRISIMRLKPAHRRRARESSCFYQ